MHYINYFIDEVIERMTALETRNSEAAAWHRKGRMGKHRQIPSTDILTSRPSTLSDDVRSDVGSVLDSSMLLLKEMPQDACPAVVFVTDGVMSLPQAGAYDNVVLRMARQSIPFTVSESEVLTSVTLHGVVLETQKG